MLCQALGLGTDVSQPQLGDLRLAATLLHVSARLREETGMVRQPIYEPRYQRVAAAVASETPDASFELDEFIAALPVPRAASHEALA